jgi:hypothetical protein
MNKYTFYADPRWFGDIIEDKLVKNKWVSLLPKHLKDKYWKAAEYSVKKGNWNLFWKAVNSHSSDGVKYSLYYLPKPMNLKQVVNHFPNIDAIAIKPNLIRTLQTFMNPFDIIPETFIFDNKSAEENYKKIIDSSNKYWIAKPENEFGGFGIKFFNSSEKAIDYVKQAFEKAVEAQDYRRKDIDVIRKIDTEKEWIIQKYIAKPLLYKGRKFDVRVHVLILENGDIYICNYGYLRTSSEKYNLRLYKDDTKNNLIHITNQAYQIVSENFGKYEEGNTPTFKEFEDYLVDEYGNKGKKMMEKMWNDWVNITVMILRKSFPFINDKGKKVPNRTYYELLGLDFMVDEDLKSWLLEVNINPALNDKTSWGKKTIPKLLEETLEIGVYPYIEKTKRKDVYEYFYKIEN